MTYRVKAINADNDEVEFYESSKIPEVDMIHKFQNELTRIIGVFDDRSSSYFPECDFRIIVSAD